MGRAELQVAADRALILRTLRERGLSLRDFTSPKPQATILYILGCWSFVVLGVAAWFESAVLAIGIFAPTQHAMLSATHEASHRGLARNRRLNRILGNLFFALPVGQTVQSYAINHEPHHNSINTPADTAYYMTNPDLSRRQIALVLLSLLFGRVLWDMALRTLTGARADKNFVSTNAAKVAKIERVRLALLIAFHTPLIALAAATGNLWIWIAWTVSTITLVPFLDALRTIAEHRIADRIEFGDTRSHHKNRIISTLCAPMFQYHWEHHALPGIPHCQLKRLHRILLDAGLKRAQPHPWGIGGALVAGLRVHGRQ